MSGREGMQLGRLPRKFSPKTLLFKNYLLPTAPPPPPSKAYYEYKVTGPWNVLGNDQFGDCTCAGPAHELMLRTAHTGTIVAPTQDEVLAMYAMVCPGFNPVGDVNDNGAAITDALNYMLQTGLAGHKIAGWAQIDQANQENVKQGVYIFGSVNIGVNLPNSAMNQTQAGQAWSVLADDGGIDGGHCIPIVGYGAEGCTCVTWGQLQQMTWEWFAKYCDEAYCEVSADWIGANGVAVNSLDMEELNADLAALKS